MLAIILIVGIGVVMGVLEYLGTMPKSEVVVDNEIERGEIKDEIEKETKEADKDKTTDSFSKDIFSEDLKTYRDEKNGVEFQYPKNMPFFKAPELLVNSIDSDGLSVKICNEEESNNLIIKEIIAGKNTFCSYVTEEGAAGSIYKDHRYSIIKGNKSYTIHFIIKHTSCGVYGDKNEKKYIECEEYNNKTVPEAIDMILSTFKFIEKDED